MQSWNLYNGLIFSHGYTHSKSYDIWKMCTWYEIQDMLRHYTFALATTKPVRFNGCIVYKQNDAFRWYYCWLVYYWIILLEQLDPPSPSYFYIWFDRAESLQPDRGGTNTHMAQIVGLFRYSQQQMQHNEAHAYDEPLPLVKKFRADFSTITDRQQQRNKLILSW